MKAVEDSLIAISKIPAGSGHALHKGTPRESFIKTFLQSHLSSNVEIGTGEIIDSSSLPNKPRNQFDIVIYKKNYPKLDFGSQISGFLAESVIATIEVKSILDQQSLNQSSSAAQNAKALNPNVIRSFSSGWIPPKILNYVVAYDGPSKMTTVHGNLLKSYNDLNIQMPIINQQEKLQTAGTALDGIFLLNKGFITLDNTPLTFVNPNTHQNGIHTIVDTSDGALLMLFLYLQQACNNIDASWLDPIPYVSNLKFDSVLYI